MASKNCIKRISGPVVEATLEGAKLYDIVQVGDEKLIGEVIKIVGAVSVIQVYEDTSGLKPGEPVSSRGMPLSVELGPGILKNIYDGIQRPLAYIEEKAKGVFITRGIEAPPLDRKKKWDFKAKAKKGDKVKVGDILGTVQETELIEHRVLCPYEGKIESISSGDYTVAEAIGQISHEGKKKDLKLSHYWPVRKARGCIEKFPPVIPLVTGQRVIDTFFPIAKGGTSCIPGPFGSGKCVSGDTPVFLADGSLITMEELYKNCRNSGSSELFPEEEIISLNRPLSVYSLGSCGINKAMSQTFYKGKSNSLVKIRTRSGRSVEVTPVHKLFRITGEGEIAETMAKDLRTGDSIVAIRKIKTELADKEISIYGLGEARAVDDGISEKVSAWIKVAGKRGMPLDIPEATLKNLKNKAVTPKLKWISEICPKIGIPLPEIKFVRGQRRGTEVKLPSKITPELSEFLGLFVAEGYIRGERVAVFTNTDEVLLSRFSGLALSLFGVKCKLETQEGKAPNLLLSSKAVVDFIGLLGVGENSATKRIPNLLMGSSDKSLAAFLKGYFLGDGSFYDGDIELSTASRQLSLQLSYLLTRFGIMHSSSHNEARHRIFVRGLNNLGVFHEVLQGKESKVDSIKEHVDSKKTTYASSDVVPLSPEFIKEAYENSGISYSALKGSGIEIHNYIGNGEKMSVSTFRKFSGIASQAAGNQVMALKCARLAEMLEWVYCDEIIEKEERFGVFDVYDVSIPQLENFVGGFGGLLLHNTVTQQSLAKHSDAQIIVYIGCGERGNEMTEVLTEFPHLIDPKTGKPLMERTVLIANTSNMPVAAREASIYTGITIAEYYRDMGYDVALMADSTSRWAEAMREIGGRLEEMPGEEGYPAYLARKLAEFYERAGRVRCLGSDERYGSITVVGAVSPPGGDLSEPVSQNTLRVTKVYLALDASLAYKRHFPAINWLKSYSLYIDSLEEWYAANASSDFPKLRRQAMALLQKEAELQEIVQLVGSDALPEKEQAVLMATRLIREDYLQQNAYSEVDAKSSMKKQYAMLKTVLKFYERSLGSIDLGVQLKKIADLPVRAKIGRMKEIPENKLEEIDKLSLEMDSEFDGLVKK